VTRVAATAPTIHVTVRIENTCGRTAAPLSILPRSRTHAHARAHTGMSSRTL
jgi:hypothetical protein